MVQFLQLLHNPCAEPSLMIMTILLHSILVEKNYLKKCFFLCFFQKCFGGGIFNYSKLSK